MGTNTLINVKFPKSKSISKGVWVDLKVVTIRFMKKIDDNSRDINQIFFDLIFVISIEKDPYLQVFSIFEPNLRFLIFFFRYNKFQIKMKFFKFG